MEPSVTATRPVAMGRGEFQQALQRIVRDMRPSKQMMPRQAAQQLLSIMETAQHETTVAASGDWKLEQYRGQGYTFFPVRQEDAAALVPQAEAALKEKYIRWCANQGGGDCLGLLDDDPFLRTDDRRTLALAFALSGVLTETHDAITAELLSTRALVSMIVWTVALYCMMWVVPEPTTKALAATLTVLLIGYLGIDTMYGLMSGWARLAETAHQATTFEELRAAGERFGKALGQNAARVMILAVTALSGHTLGQALPRFKALPSFNLAGAQFEAQGGTAALARAEATEAVVTTQGALAQALAAVEVVVVSPQGPIAVVMSKTRTSSATTQAPGGRATETVLRHRGGNRQVELSDGQRWHLPRDKSVADIPTQDRAGDALQEAVTQAAKNWGPDKLSAGELAAMQKAEMKGAYWLSRLLEREARGRYVQMQVKARFERLYDFSLSKSVDVVDPATGIRYEILSGTASNLARHGRRMAGEFFRMLTF
ncbi:hypothetical protein [Archangium primigenium]|uniref:SitA5 family polymorphic toxin n=1 Tax=[Archangium] primigenium TaxID=2792470 RepID=UPI001EF7E7F3|nr:hypothetical protein [Archangium primigenium]